MAVGFGIFGEVGIESNFSFFLVRRGDRGFIFCSLFSFFLGVVFRVFSCSRLFGGLFVRSIWYWKGRWIIRSSRCFTCWSFFCRFRCFREGMINFY